ncbi:MAG: LysM peptidoglycan-binding domain-containing protein [Chloroflexi bacterium]|nr:MAG: LysM peptidoglycan-binding domain-containing protein [Chloroflexota bacterium]MBL1196503.1 LysM peptidoglycan-binding domain-containing protein [Chloroflexota bacterium]NOH13798.1 LysM peptidoglycan-binding domain-containing protein [Chloroflexota bacterium]
MRRRFLRPFFLTFLLGSFILIGLLALAVWVAPAYGLETDLASWITYFEELTAKLGDQLLSTPPPIEQTFQLEAAPFISPTAREFPASPSVTPEESATLEETAIGDPPDNNSAIQSDASTSTTTLPPASSATVTQTTIATQPATATPSRTATSTHVAIACNPPVGWTSYIVQAGETLAQLAIRHSTTVAILQSANCLTSSLIFTGQLLYVPNNLPPTATPTVTPTPTITRTATRTSTSTIAPTSTQTLVPSATRTPTRTLTPTVFYSPTITRTPTVTSTGTQTPVSSNTPTLTNTPQGPQPTPTVDLSGCSFSNQSSLENEILSLINQARADNGLAALSMHSSLRSSARAHSNDMSCNDFVSHNGSNGTDVYIRMTAHGYYPSWWGENIYMGFSNTVQSTFNWWMSSTPHRANILNPNYIHIGVGHSDGNGYNAYTLNFGRP